MSWRLLAVSALALAMGLIFGGLRVASAADSAASFGRVSQLANLGQQVTVLVQGLEYERDLTTGSAPLGTQQVPGLPAAYVATDTAAATVRTLAAGIGSSFPANIQANVANVLSFAGNLGQVRTLAQDSQSSLAAVAAYAPAINAMIALNNQIAQGTSDAALVNDVQTLSTLSQVKDQASQQRALLYNAILNTNFADGELQALQTAQTEQDADQTTLRTTETSAENADFIASVFGPKVSAAEAVETYILDNGAVDLATLQQGGFNDPPVLAKTWFADETVTIQGMQAVELRVAENIVARAQVLQQGAESSALITGVLTVVILLLVAIATLVVSRSLVRPLRRLRADALNIATVQLPQRVRRLGESPDAAASLDVVPIDVTSGDEIGQVARAFDQVHAEAVRLAGNEALLRNSYNAMFVNLSRRSQSLIERLVRMIDSLEQNEDDPTRLSSLFSMDHLVTRMRRNSENLLLLAGHDTARKWSEPAPLTDVARAAISEIEQYSRVALNIQQGVSVAGPAVSDVVHLLAELIENATTFSPKDTQVQVTAQEINSGGALIEVIDSGVGIPDDALAEINARLDDPPVIDVSVSRHMGLFAVARLAERHGVRVRLRYRSPEGIIAMVWLPDSILQETDRPFGRVHPALRQNGVQGRRTVGAASRSSLPAMATHGVPAAHNPPPPEAPAPPREPARSGTPARPGGGRPGAVASSRWFSDPRGQGGGTMGTSGLPGRPAEQPGFGVRFPAVADPVHGDPTSSGLPLRVPLANLIPGSMDSTRQAGSAAPGFQPGSSMPGFQADRRETQPAASGLPQRTPDIARSRMSGFQRGVRRGKSQTPRAGEGTDR